MAVGSTLVLPLTIAAGPYTKGVDIVVSGSVSGTASFTAAELNAGGIKNVNVTVGNVAVGTNSFTVTIEAKQNEAPTAALPSNPGTLVTTAQPSDENDANYVDDMTAWKAQVVAALKSKPDGVYSFTDEITNATNWDGSSMGYDVGSGVGRLAFVFRSASSSNEYYYLVIKNAAGETVIVNEAQFGDSAKHYFYFDQRYIDENIRDQYMPSLCATGKAIGTGGLTPGAVYTWQVLKSGSQISSNSDLETALGTSANIMASGAFRAETGLADKSVAD